MVEKVSGIYRIVCVKNGRYYYGSSKNIHARWNAHLSQLKNCKHNNLYMQRVWNKHGESSFRVELVEAVEESRLLEIEQRYLNEHVGKSNCMNVALDAMAPMRGRLNPAAGKLFGDDNPSKRPEVKQKISQSLMGHEISDETKRKISQSKVGKSNGWLGRTHFPEARRKISEANTGKVPWNKGKKRSDYDREKIRLGMRRYYGSLRK